MTLQRMRLPQTRRGKLLVFVAGSLGLCLCACVGLAVLTNVGRSLGIMPTLTPTMVAQAAAVRESAPTSAASVNVAPTATETAGPPATKTARPTNTPKPTNTPRPTRTPRPTDTPRPPTNTPGPTNTPAPTDTPEPTSTPRPPTATPSAGERVQDAVKSLRNAKVTVTDDVAVVEYEAFDFSEASLINAVVHEFRLITPKVLAVAPEVNLFSLRGRAEFSDKYGNTSWANAMGLTITRAVAEKINWQNIVPQNIGPLLATEKGCSVYVHPALQSAYRNYIGQ